jgi:hypothetical protein
MRVGRLLVAVFGAVLVFTGLGVPASSAGEVLVTKWEEGVPYDGSPGGCDFDIQPNPEIDYEYRLIGKLVEGGEVFEGKYIQRLDDEVFPGVSTDYVISGTLEFRGMLTSTNPDDRLDFSWPGYLLPVGDEITGTWNYRISDVDGNHVELSSGKFTVDLATGEMEYLRLVGSCEEP